MSITRKKPSFRQAAPLAPGEITDRLLAGHRALLLARLSEPAAHEIINPISAVVNLGSLIQHIAKEEGIPNQRIPEIRDYCSQIISEATRAGRYASDLLTFSRAAHRTHGFIHIDEIIRQTCALASHLLKVEDIAVEFQLAESLPWAEGNRNEIQQSLLNVIVNAVEALEGCDVRRIIIGSRIEENHIIMFVGDRGPGIPAEIAERIFDPFFTTKTRAENLGLGLTIARAVFEEHRGSIHAGDHPPQGAMIQMLLPISAEGS